MYSYPVASIANGEVSSLAAPAKIAELKGPAKVLPRRSQVSLRANTQGVAAAPAANVMRELMYVTSSAGLEGMPSTTVPTKLASPMLTGPALDAAAAASRANPTN